MKKKLHDHSYCVKALCLFFSISFLIACPIAATYLDVWDKLLSDWWFILTSPCPLVTDYFQVGNLASAFLNAGVCGLACTILMYALNAECLLNSFAGYFLVVAHCFYGLNFLNMWPPMLGILVFCRFYKINFKDNLAIAFFSTAFGPFISELLFRYHVNGNFYIYIIQISVLSIIYAILFSLFLGFAIPAMLPGALRLHKGFNLYNGGLAFGLLGIFLYSFMYKTFGIIPQESLSNNPIYASQRPDHMTFVLIFFAIVFIICFVWGWYLNGRSFKGYGDLIRSTGHNTNYLNDYGMPVVMINIGIYGFMIIAYFTAVVKLTNGVGFTGATVGVILAALSFTAKGQHPRNVWPILVGYVVLYAIVIVICSIAGLNVPWTLSTQGYINGAAFATGLAPIAGYYGKRYGIIAGFMCAVMCTSTSSMHGGFMLYNGGFTAGITALILIPCLEYYWKGKKTRKQKRNPFKSTKIKF